MSADLVMVAADDAASTGVVPFDGPVPADQNPYLVYIGSLGSDGSRLTMAGCLDRLARLALHVPVDDKTVTGVTFPWWSLRYQHTARLRALVMEQGWSPAHANKHLAALRQVLRSSWRLGLMTEEDRARASDLEKVPGSRLRRGRMLAEHEIATLLDACLADRTVAGERDAALLAVAYSSGARRAELVSADLADWDPVSGLRLLGKGNKERRVFLAPWAVRYLDVWLRRRGEAPGPLFVRCQFMGKADTAGRVMPGLHRLTTQTVADVAQRRSAQIDGRPFTPHDLRRTLISTLLSDPETDLVTVQNIAGHASPVTTASYDRRGSDAAKAASTRIRDPHAGRA